MVILLPSWKRGYHSNQLSSTVHSFNHGCANGNVIAVENPE